MLLLALILQLGAPWDVKVTRWASPESTKPISFSQWFNSNPYCATWSTERLARIEGPLDLRVGILVEDSLVAPLRPGLDTLVSDIALQGYDVSLVSVKGNSAESLRSYLKAEHDSGLVAAVLVGDLPIPWFQLIDDWNSNGVRDPDEHYEEFPCDLFLMDLDGIWQDDFIQLDSLDSLVPGTDSIYDSHTGDLNPEIGISRLPAAAVGEEIPLLSSYLDKAHKYRTGRLNVLDRALVHIDDDWIPQSWLWYNDVGLLYPERVWVWDKESTRAADYRPRLDSAAYQWIQLCAHSWPGGHGWKYNDGRSWDWFWADEIEAINPDACFYNLFACSNARFTEPGFSAGCYVFHSSTGLGAIGSTKTGSMLEFGDFYGPLSQSEPLGLAFRTWFEAQTANGIEPWERSWFYGMSLIGDGLLKPRLSTGVEQPRLELKPASDLQLLSSPAHRKLSLELNLSRSARTRITLCDPAGRVVRVLLDQWLHSGPSRLTFGASDLGSGVYLLTVSTGSDRWTIPIPVIN